MPAPRQLTLTCARCGRPAAEIRLAAAETAGPEVWATGDRLERLGFLGSVIRYGPYAELVRWFDGLEQGAWAAARGADADFLAFICWSCGRPYCEACWGPRRLVFEEDGFYDCAYADCPEGHEQIVDD